MSDENGETGETDETGETGDASDSDSAGEYAEAMDGIAREVTELGMLAMDAFKYAAAALFDPDSEVIQSALAASTASADLTVAVHQNAVGALARFAPAGAALRALVALQRAAAEYARMAGHARQVAECAGALAGSAEVELAHLAPAAPRLLAGLVHQGYIALRGCLILPATGDRALARRIMAEDAEMERLYVALRNLLNRGIAGQPGRAAALQNLARAANGLRQIGSCVVAICEDGLG
jgi:phosphate uptake regulator